MFLSIIIPVYNCEKYISECLYSCIHQNIEYSDYEIICINDGSTDNSLSIINEIAKKHVECNIRLLSIPNSGVSHARNIGIEAALGDYVWFVDADDFIAENCLGELRVFSEKEENKKIKVCSYSFNDYFDETLKKSAASKQLRPNSPYKYTVITRTLIKRSIILDNSIRFKEDLSYGEDTLFNYETRIHCPKDIDSGILAYYYRIHSESITRIETDEKKNKSLDSCKRLVEYLYAFYCTGTTHKITTDLLTYRIEMLLLDYYKFSEDYFLLNFSWNKLDVKITDVALWWLNNFCVYLAKNNDYRALKRYIKFYNLRIKWVQFVKIKKKRLVGYMKHPKRLFKIF